MVSGREEESEKEGPEVQSSDDEKKSTKIFLEGDGSIVRREAYREKSFLLWPELDDQRD